MIWIYMISHKKTVARCKSACHLILYGPDTVKATYSLLLQVRHQDFMTIFPFIQYKYK